MKTVFTKADDVIHLFAQKRQDDARSSNMFFKKDYEWKYSFGNVLYSYGYHYELARFIDLNTVYINDSGYSVTTAKHIRSVQYATRQYKQFLKTRTDLGLVHTEVSDLFEKWKKARKPEKYQSEILSLWESLNEYIQFSKIKCKRSKKYLYIKKIVSSINSGSAEDVEKYRKEQANKERLKQKKELLKSIKDFNSYKIHSFRIGNEDYLRISKDGKSVQTSQNINVDINEAKTLYSLIKRGVNIRGYKIGYYTVNSINGTLKIGCHNINIDSVKDVGEKILKSD